MKLERDSVQLAFSFYFFDDGCWNCANPFHHRPACFREDNRTLHLIAKQMHEINHPLTPEQLMKKFEDKLRFKK
jgi:hypothetical protein